MCSRFKLGLKGAKKVVLLENNVGETGIERLFDGTFPLSTSRQLTALTAARSIHSWSVHPTTRTTRLYLFTSLAENRCRVCGLHTCKTHTLPCFQIMKTYSSRHCLLLTWCTRYQRKPKHTNSEGRALTKIASTPFGVFKSSTPKSLRGSMYPKDTPLASSIFLSVGATTALKAARSRVMSHRVDRYNVNSRLNLCRGRSDRGKKSGK